MQLKLVPGIIVLIPREQACSPSGQAQLAQFLPSCWPVRQKAAPVFFGCDFFMDFSVLQMCFACFLFLHELTHLVVSDLPACVQPAGQNRCQAPKNSAAALD